MNKCIVFVLLAGLSLVCSSPKLNISRKSRGPDACEPTIVAHRGASGYVPEHTIGAYALAITMGADYIEPDLVMTKDGHLIARHENELSLSTDVAQHPEFANRYQTKFIDGRNITGWFSEDFTLAEIKTLRATELLRNVRVGNTRMDGSFDIPTMQEIIDLAKGFEGSEGRIIGVYPEIKHPTYFQLIGLAMEKLLVDLLHDNGYRGPEAPAYIQSFEVSNLKELKTMTDLRLLQLISGNSQLPPVDQFLLGTGLTYGQMATASGLREIATYASAVGPAKSLIIPLDSGRLGTPTSFVQDAHAAGLKVHPFTFRAENPYLPVEFRSADGLDTSLGDSAGEMQAFLNTGIDGLFTDQPDILARLRGPCSFSDDNDGASSGNQLWFSKYFLLFVMIVIMV
ncbi:glycerophosphoryl diester phosphodiesterase family domain-containing protein [Phthorimaea operculella]|nr:glycerophosphoryl diester phosphodiesterase family domain-containing protein [Phthorimaea operculella]